MSNATRWYCTREAIKNAVGIAGSHADSLIDQKAEAASADVERLLSQRRFIPETATKVFMPRTSRQRRDDWAESENPWLYGGSSRVVETPDLLAATTIKIDENADGTYSETALSATEYELLPRNQTPKKFVQLTEYGTTYSFPAGHRVQIVGRWAFSEDTKAAGALAEALDSSETGVDVTDASLIGVGDTLLIDTEAMFVSGKSLLDTTANTAGALTASASETTVPVNTGTLVKQGEVIQIDSERMLVESISGNNLTVKRAVDGTVLATHANPSDVYAYRLLTVVRGVNGTTAATHDTAAAISKYVPPADITELCIAEAIAHLKQDESGWTGQISGGEGSIAVKMVDLFYLRQRVLEKYGNVTL